MSNTFAPLQEHFICVPLFVYQGFQEAVSESAGRLNALLQQGEELIQRSEPADAQVIEGQLQELLLYCARVFQGLGRLHTRLLSMRLVSITTLLSQKHAFTKLYGLRVTLKLQMLGDEL